jgi:hypothetical protein
VVELTSLDATTACPAGAVVAASLGAALVAAGAGVGATAFVAPMSVEAGVLSVTGAAAGGGVAGAASEVAAVLGTAGALATTGAFATPGPAVLGMAVEETLPESGLELFAELGSLVVTVLVAPALPEAVLVTDAGKFVTVSVPEATLVSPDADVPAESPPPVVVVVSVLVSVLPELGVVVRLSAVGTSPELGMAAGVTPFDADPMPGAALGKAAITEGI